jgi:tetratricopeptide (TPR) repeat protein
MDTLNILLMANATNRPAILTPGQSGPGGARDYEPPPSLPLQIFLFCAFLLTVAAYVCGQRSDAATEHTIALARDAKLDRQTVDRGKYLAYTKLGFQEEEHKNFAAAISNFQNAVLLQNTFEAHTNLGYALLLDSRTNDALKEFQAALTLNPRFKRN